MTGVFGAFVEIRGSERKVVVSSFRGRVSSRRSGITRKERFRPSSTSVFVYPYIFSPARFQLVITPSVVFPMMASSENSTMDAIRCVYPAYVQKADFCDGK